MSALHQDINLDAVIFQFRFIVDLHLLQSRISSSHPVPCLHANKHVSNIQKGLWLEKMRISDKTLGLQMNTIYLLAAQVNWLD